MEKEGISPGLERLIIKKDFFIKSRQEDIRNIYEFSPKVQLCPILGFRQRCIWSRLQS